MGVPWVMGAMAQLYGRAKVADRVPAIVNLTISNVPGPTMPLYMAGARMLSNHPASIVVHGVALNVTVQTYDEALDIGIMACAKAMPEVAEFARCIDAAWAEFEALPAAPAPAASSSTGAPSTAKPRAKRAARPEAPVTTTRIAKAARKPVAGQDTKRAAKPRAATPIAARGRR
jgi:diacylglycerol O-acyltransferase / wax synthase